VGATKEIFGQPSSDYDDQGCSNKKKKRKIKKLNVVNKRKSNNRWSFVVLMYL